MSFLGLPNELLLKICTSPVLEIPDIASVLRTCHRLAIFSTCTLLSEILKRRSDEYCQRALCYAAENYYYSTFSSLLDGGILDIISIGPIYLNVVVHYMSEEGITNLVDCGVDPNTIDGRGCTPLVCATVGGHFCSVRGLLSDPRVDVNHPWLFPDFTAFHLAVWIGNVSIVRLFLEESPEVDVNRVDEIRRTELETIQHDINRGCLPNFVADSLPDGLGLQPYGFSWLENRAPDGSWLVPWGASQSFPDFTGYHHYIFDAYDLRVKQLSKYRDRGEEMHLDSENEMEPIILKTIISDLRERAEPTFLGKVINAVRVPLRRGWAPLHGAVAQDDCRILRILLAYAATDVNVVSADMETPLFTSVRLGNEFAVRLLLAHHETNICMETKSILHFAVSVARKSMIQILLENTRIDVNLRDGNQKTALHMAASNGRMDAVELLLGHIDTEMERLDGEGFSGRDLALPSFPEVARYITMVQIAGRREIEYLDIASESGNRRWAWGAWTTRGVGHLLLS